MGVVYRARHTELGHEVALKLLAPSAGSAAGTGELPETRSGDTGMPSAVSSRRWIERFRREAQAAGRLGTHDGIVGVLDVGEDQGRLYLAMQLITGHALDEEIRGRVLEVPDAFRLVGTVARAVEYAHSQGIIHRDLKPGNILIDREQRPWVTDFGLAARTALDAESQKITRTQDVVGTPAYLAPEQLRGEAVDARTDVHALGCTLYELLTGATPFESEWLPVTCRRVLQDVPPPPSAKRPAVPRAADAVVLRCLAKDPADRYPTAAALAEDCERIASGEAPLTRPSGVVSRAARWTRRRRGPLAVAGGVGLAVVAGLGAIAWSLRHREQAEEQRHDTGVAAARLDARRARAVEFGRLAQRTQADIRLLQDHFHEAVVSPEAVAAAVARVRAAAGTVAPGDPGAAAAAAWVALAELYAASGPDPWAAFDRVPAADAADPFPAMVTALARVEALVKGWRAAGRTTPVGEALAELPPSRRAADALREAAERALAAIPPVRPDHFNAELTALYELLAGARLVVTHQHDTARTALTPSQDDPFLGALATYLLGRSAVRAGEFAQAEQYLGALAAARGWRDALRGQAHALALAAQRSRADAAAWKALLERADAVIAQLFAGTPSPADYGERGRLGVERAAWMYDSRLDGRAVLDRAIDDLERERRAKPGANAIVLSLALVMRADAADHAGADPRPYLKRAQTVLEAAAEESPARVTTLLEQRVRVETELAELACRAGVAPAEAFAPAVDAARAMLRRHPESAALHHHLGSVYLRQSDA
ncbi:MAG: serine/threonine-protein kinase, partial [Planctomycetota bacterium]